MPVTLDIETAEDAAIHVEGLRGLKTVGDQSTFVRHQPREQGTQSFITTSRDPIGDGYDPSRMPAATITPASTPDNIGEVRALFEEYGASLGFSLCFQNFDHELAELPGAYGPPRGRPLLARVDGVMAGCVALRPLDERACELKRLFVRPAFAGQGIGRWLATSIIDAGRAAGYAAMRLDTVPTMRVAIGLYASLGFVDIAPYRESPIAGARYLELRLR